MRLFHLFIPGMLWMLPLAPAGDLGDWQIFEPLKTARQEVAVAVLDERVYVIGGFNGTGSSVNTVERYDPVNPPSNRWETLPDLISVDPLNHVASVALDGMLYTIGGLRQNFSAVNTVFKFDPVDNSWRACEPLPFARGALSAAVINGRIYAAGGFPSSRSNDFTVYDPASDSWDNSMANMPTPRDHLAAAAWNGKFYAFGGRFQGSLRAATECYDPISGEWVTGEPIPTPRAGIAAAEFNGRIYIFGGEGNPLDPNGVFNEVEEYNPGTDSWRSLEMMPVPRHGIGAALLNGRIHIPGGGPIEGFGVTSHHDAFIPPPPASRVDRSWVIY
jgi:N-acetylneuraminic acid mutarotase